MAHEMTKYVIQGKLKLVSGVLIQSLKTRCVCVGVLLEKKKVVQYAKRILTKIQHTPQNAQTVNYYRTTFINIPEATV